MEKEQAFESALRRGLVALNTELTNRVKGADAQQAPEHRSYSESGDANQVAVGDLNSNAKGSGARKNLGKAPLDLIPIRYWANKWDELAEGGVAGDVMTALVYLGHWQETPGDDGRDSLYQALSRLERYYDDATRVFEFGAKKYARWNWAKGMDWDIPVGCILRHARAIIEDHQLIDDDSGESHVGCIVCNLIMLDWFQDHYPEGDTRPIFEDAPDA